MIPNKYIPLGIGFAVASTLVGLISYYKIGPRIMWASDLCPEPNVTCGVMPVGPILAAIVGSIVAVYTAGMIDMEVPENA